MARINVKARKIKNTRWKFGFMQYKDGIVPVFFLSFLLKKSLLWEQALLSEAYSEPSQTSKENFEIYRHVFFREVKISSEV